MPGPPWTDEELRHVSRCRTPADCYRLAERLKRTPIAVNAKRLRLGRRVYTRKRWTAAEDAKLVATDPTVRGWSIRIAAELGRTPHSVRSRRSRLLGYIG